MKVILLWLFFTIAPFVLMAQTVNTSHGPITGHMNGNIYEFLGIPFASPPVDTLRWKPTLPPTDWVEPISADSFPPKCPQKKYDMGDTAYTLEGEEDCLYLNVWSPDISGNYPVMVFIHGGGNQQGSSSQISGGTFMYHGKNLSERGDIVLVTIQYRLGALGYLVHPGLEAENVFGISGNYGVMDQIFALEWVKDNISEFGGDPANVTIFGESGGGVNVGNLMTTPMAEGLFHRAIIQSATPLINNYDTAYLEGIDFVNEFLSTGTDSAKIAFMRNVHPDSISMKNSSPLEGGIVQMAWQPVLDNHIFSDYPDKVFQSGSFNQVPLIIGTNADEMLPLVPPTVFPFMLNAFVKSFVPDQYQASVLDLYPTGDTTTVSRESYAGILTDGQFTTTSRRTAQCVSLNQTEPVYRYFFSHTHNPSVPILGEFGAYHGIELFYVFNTWENSPLAFGPLFTDQDDSVQKSILKYWTNFARMGNPNDGLLPIWPEYDAATDCYIEIKASPDNTQCGLRTEKSNLWDEISAYTVCTSSVGVDMDQADNRIVNLYPNPTYGKLNIQSGFELQDIKISIYNLTGKELWTGSYENEMDIRHFPPGAYLVRVSCNKGIEISKIIKLN